MNPGHSRDSRPWNSDPLFTSMWGHWTRLSISTSNREEKSGAVHGLPPNHPTNDHMLRSSIMGFRLGSWIYGYLWSHIPHISLHKDHPLRWEVPTSTCKVVWRNGASGTKQLPCGCWIDRVHNSQGVDGWLVDHGRHYMACIYKQCHKYDTYRSQGLQASWTCNGNH